MNAIPTLMAILLGTLSQDKQNPLPIQGWEPDLSSGFAEARSTGRPLMIVFR